MRQIPALCLLLLLLGGCSEDPPLPPAQPLTTDAQVINALYGVAAGELAVTRVENLSLPEHGDDRTLSFNLYYPTHGSNFPLIVFSHGNWSNKDSYNRLIEHWVSHGYVVVAPDHLDCCGMAKGIFASLRYGQLGLINGRVSDLRRMRSAVPALAQTVPGFAGKADMTRVAMAGHSFGAYSAQQFGGAAAFDPDTGEYSSAMDDSVRAIVAVSPPGPMFDVITTESWEGLALPTLVTTGTWDVQPSFWPDWQDHLQSFNAGAPQDKFALVIEGADHFLGNLICRLEREAEPQHDALAMVRATSTAFLDYYVKNLPDGSDLLQAGHLEKITGGFARVMLRPAGSDPGS